MIRLRRSPLVEYLARPGCKPSYTQYETAKLLETTNNHVKYLIKKNQLRATCNGRNWWIPRSSVIAMAKMLYRDRPIKLARVLAGPRSRMIALVNDLAIRRMLASFRPIFCSSPFSLGQSLLIKPCSSIVVDWEASGIEWARDIASRLSECPDRPPLIGILPEFQDIAGKGWDIFVKRPCKQADLRRAVAQVKR